MAWIQTNLNFFIETELRNFGDVANHRKEITSQKFFQSNELESDSQTFDNFEIDEI